jgi:hypothetical protein
MPRFGHEMNSEDPCRTCALRTAAERGWCLEAPADHPTGTVRRCQAVHEEEDAITRR